MSGGGFHGGGGFSGGRAGGYGGGFRGGAYGGGRYGGGYARGFNGGYGRYGYGRYGYGRGWGWGGWGWGLGWGWPYWGYPYYSGYYDPGYYPYYDTGYYSDPPYTYYQDGGGGTPGVVVNQGFHYDTPAPDVRDYNKPPNDRTDYQPVMYLIALKDHNTLAVLTYWVEAGSLHYVTADHEMKQVPLSSVDRDLSERLNRERHLAFRLPAGA
jgi:hypothetical protein